MYLTGSNMQCLVSRFSTAGTHMNCKNPQKGSFPSFGV
uniref:Uncharacterized protein n=1 Tax=Anguilla anguilla TaxID=7936 RepID=A0A0E9QVA9_ANGAN